MAKREEKTVEPVRRPRGRPAGGSADQSVRDRLLDVAEEMFSAQDFEAVSVRELTERAGVTYSAVYHYFGDKRGLFIASYVRRLAEVSRRLRASLKIGATPEERIWSFMLEQCRVHREPGAMRMVQRQSIGGDREVMHAVADRTGFAQQIDELIAEIAQVCGPEQAPRRAIDLYVMPFGYTAIGPIFDAIDRLATPPESVADHARYVLGRVLPERDWTAMREA